jgi:hypothetical protein
MSAVSDLQGLTDLSQCAYALGLAFGEEAKAASDTDRKIRFFELFERCFHGFRVAVTLKQRLARAPQAERSEAEACDAQHRPERPDPQEHERAERIRLDYDRDREAASLPILLKTLNRVVDEAQGLPGPHPAELPTLRELLACVGAPRPAAASAAARPRTATASAAGVTLLARPAAAAPPSARSRLLLGAAATPQPVRRATGPPKR